jgi:glycosyltransferase involved in cell wall biosynthesis
MQTAKSSWPRISVVTPSFNQAEFLERTLRSVLDQKYPNLEYIVIDGGSTDGSADIIRHYADRLAYWVSEADAGQTAAINKGLRRATGEWVAWQNSDDIYYQGVFHDLADAASRNPKAELIIGDMMLIDEHDHPLRDIRYVRPCYRGLLAEGMVLTNQAAFWRRSLHEKVGLLNEEYHYAFDYEWFLRLVQHAQVAHVARIWGGYRLHDKTKTSLLGQRFDEERRRILAGRTVSSWEKPLYKLRRLGLMLSNGQIAYVARGLLRHVRGKGGEPY